MAKVDSVSVNNSSGFFVNRPSFRDLKFSLEITEECSADDFDISLLLGNNETQLRKVCVDNVITNEINRDNKEGGDPSLNSLQSIDSPRSSLGSLSKNSFKKEKMLPELRLDSNFSWSDLLSNDDYPPEKASKDSCENVNLFDLCLLAEEDNCSSGRKSSQKCDVTLDDLSDWIGSSVTQSSESLLFHSDKFLQNDFKDKQEETIPFDSFATKTTDGDVKLSDCLYSSNKKANECSNISEISVENLLSELSNDYSKTTDNANENKYKSKNDVSDDCLPDIDLTFCIIKKNNKCNISSYGNSPETVDSGFDESDFISPNCTTSSEASSLYNDILIPQKNTSPFINTSLKNNKIKQSLFSQAISAKPKMNDVRKEKLKKVMFDLKKCIPLIHPNCPIYLSENPKILDHSNENIITSSYLKVPDEI